MATFNVMEASTFGYRLVWRERRYLLYLAAIPLLIKFICHMTVAVLGWRSEFMRQAIVMLPAYFAYGWMLSHVTRLIFLEQRWPFRTSGNGAGDRIALEDRARCVMAGTLSFVIVEFLMSGFLDGVYQLAVAASDIQSTPSKMVSLAMAVAAAGLIWLFRYFWFYIPASIGYPLPAFSQAMKGYATSIYMMAVWLATTVPGMMVYFFFISALVPVAPATGLPLTLGGEFFAGLTGALADTVIIAITTAAMAHGIRSMIEAHRKNH